MNCQTFPSARRHRAGFYEVDAPAVADTPVRVVDVREPHEFATLAPISTAERVPLGQLQEQAASWDRSEPIVVACRSGGRSGRAAAGLMDMGFRCVVSLRGGMLAFWEQGQKR